MPRFSRGSGPCCASRPSRRVQDQARELADWNRLLEHRVTEQVEQIGRMERLSIRRRRRSPISSSPTMPAEILSRVTGATSR